MTDTNTTTNPSIVEPAANKSISTLAFLHAINEGAVGTIETLAGTSNVMEQWAASAGALTALNVGFASTACLVGSVSAIGTTQLQVASEVETLRGAILDTLESRTGSFSRLSLIMALISLTEDNVIASFDDTYGPEVAGAMNEQLDDITSQLMGANG